MVLKFNSSVAKGLQLKFIKFFEEVTGEKLVGEGHFYSLHPKQGYLLTSAGLQTSNLPFDDVTGERLDKKCPYWAFLW